LLSHDVLWVLDEVQLMDVGLATSAQLQAFHDDDRHRGFRPRLSWWMSATLQPLWLKSVDTSAHFADWTLEPCFVSMEERREGLGAIRKSIATAEIGAMDAKGLADRLLREHDKLKDAGYGRITLVVCNTVERACATYDALRAKRRTGALELAHGRFRPYERAGWRERFLNPSCSVSGVDRIIVATQVVEAGVDVSAGCVVSDLAPWPSLVQRFGRCARYGGTGHVVVVDRGRDDKSVLPYRAEELDAAWWALESVGEVGIERLESFDESLDESARGRLYPYTPEHLLLRREFDELFDTTPDLTGADLDISRFIRTGDDRDLYVFWLDIEKKGRPPRRRSARRDELCPVQFLRARDWLCGKESKDRRKPRLLPGMRAWVWDFIEGDWAVVDRATLVPGRVVCVAADCGGYRVDRGFDPDSRVAVTVVPPIAVPVSVEAQAQSDSSQDGEDLSVTEWKTIACHTREVVDQVEAIGRSVGIGKSVQKILQLAAWWHDVGKAHPGFQGAIRVDGRYGRHDFAKAPRDAWLMPLGTYRTPDGDTRAGLRHELASALALFAVVAHYAPRSDSLLGPWVDVFAKLGHTVPENPLNGSPSTHARAVLDCTAEEFDLLVYLVACHHGKVRLSLHASPKDQDYRPAGEDGRGLPIRGVRDGDAIPSVRLDASEPPLPELVLSLDPAALGLSFKTGRSWRERTIGLVNRFGPGTLGWLEALMIAADRRASQLRTVDPELDEVVR
jgi:CRISPR-associated endonuclease/helicase Cas3